jgi:hypothetical protein
MAHPRVEQLRFTRSEWVRGLESVTATEAVRHFPPMNCISWMVGHLAWQEQRYWLERAQGRTAVPELKQYGFGAEMATPPLAETWAAWREVTRAADPFLDTVTTAMLEKPYAVEPAGETVGTQMLRMTYHYWYHLGEAMAVRQLLGHTDLPTFVGDIGKAPYRREP